MGMNEMDTNLGKGRAGWVCVNIFFYFFLFNLKMINK